jgi:hypothetical protein
MHWVSGMAHIESYIINDLLQMCKLRQKLCCVTLSTMRMHFFKREKTRVIWTAIKETEFPQILFTAYKMNFKEYIMKSIFRKVAFKLLERPIRQKLLRNEML